MKENLNLFEAFRALNDTTKNDLATSKKHKPVAEGVSYSLRDRDQISSAKEFREEDKKDVTLEVIDPEADALNHLKDYSDYIGEIILQCNVCKATKFVKLKDLKKQEDVSFDKVTIYNCDEECPHCHSQGKGYTLVGQVGKAVSEEDVHNNEDTLERPANENEESEEDTASFENDLNTEEVKLDKNSEEEVDSKEDENTGDEDIKDDEIKNESLYEEDEEDETPYDETSAHEDEDEGKRVIKFSSLFDDKDELKDLLRAKLKTKKEKVKEAKHSEKKKRITEALNRKSQKRIKESLDLNSWEGSINSFLDKFTNNDSDIKINLLSTEGNDIATYSSPEEIPFDYSIENIVKWSTNDDYILMDVEDAAEDNYKIGSTISSLFGNYKDEDKTTFLLTYHSETDSMENEITNLNELLESFGDKILSGAISVRTLNFYIDRKGKEKTYNSKEDIFTEHLIKQNGLKESKLTTSGSVENFIRESIESKEDLDKVYENFVLPLNDASLEKEFKYITGYRDETDLFLESKGIDVDKFKAYLEESDKVEEYLEKDSKKEINEEFWKSAVNRKELTQLIGILQESNLPFIVKKSLNEDYRYDIYLKKNLSESAEDDYQNEKREADLKIKHKETVKLTEEPNDLSFRHTGLASIEQPENVEAEIVNGRRHRPTTSLATTDATEFDTMIVNKVERIADDIHDSIKSNYNVDVPENLIVADIIQDLRLVGGAISAQELENTPANQVTKELYRQFEETFDGMDTIISILTGEEVHTPRAERLMSAVRSLDSRNYSSEYIEQAISSPQFLGMSVNGMVPYIDSAEITRKNMSKVQSLPSYRRRNPAISSYNPYEDERRQALTGGNERTAIGNRNRRGLPENFNTDKFEESINEYLRRTYDGNMVYTNSSAKRLSEAIIIKGELTSEEKTLPIKWTITKDRREGYNVSNTISKERIKLSESYNLK